jgi:enoyl-CoA hydratase/carnithine racemase
VEKRQKALGENVKPPYNRGIWISDAHDVAIAEGIAMDNTDVRVEIKDHIATVTMDRPPVNAMSQSLVEGLAAAFDSFDDLPEVRVAILTGAGKCFCAGADLKARGSGVKRPPGSQRIYSRAGREAFNSIMECPVPVIGAINGPALGGGLAMAAACDILVTAENATIGLPEVDVGLLGGGRHAQRMFGVYKARMLMFTGQRVTGAELYRRGIVEQCVPAERLMNAAMEIATNIAEKSPLTVRMAKKNMATVEFMNIRDGYRYEQDGTNALIHSEDSKEAVRAFLEKRKPVFK